MSRRSRGGEAEAVGHAQASATDTDRKHANSSEGFHTRGKFRSRGTKWHAVDSANYRTVRLDIATFATVIHKVSKMCKICKVGPDSSRVEIAIPHDRAPRILGVSRWEGGHGPRGVLDRYAEASREHAPSTTQSGLEPFKGSFR